MKYLITLLMILALLPTKLQANGQEKSIIYKYSSEQSSALSAAVSNGSIVTIGPQSYTVFSNDSHEIENHSGPLDVGGYSSFIEQFNDANFILAGVNYNRSWSFNDKRQNFIALVAAKNFEIIKLKEFDERITIGLEILSDGNILLLSRGDGYLNLRLLDGNLKVLKNVKFREDGRSISGSLALTAEGNYGVLGFTKNEVNNQVIPTYWEFSPELKLLDKKIISKKGKALGNGLDVLKLLRSGSEMYAIYGWDGANKKGSEIRILKMNDASKSWKDVYLPYHAGVKFFISKNGIYALYPKLEYLEKISFDSSGNHRVFKLNRPSKPADCFPIAKKYDMVDVLQAEGKDFIVLSNTELKNYFSSCVTIGEMP